MAGGAEQTQWQEKKNKHLCFHYKMLRGTKNKKQNKNTRNIVTNIEWTFYSERSVRCDATGNVDVILQSEVDQTDTINTIISHNPKWAGKHPAVLTEH